MNRICTVAVRAGSKGVPGKNWRAINGVPLFAHSVRHAVASGLFDEIAVSTDSPEVIEIAQELDRVRIVRRPPELASDSSGKVPAIVHAVSEIEQERGRKFDTVVDLDATSPLRTGEDILGAVRLLETNNYESVITGSEAHRSPYFNLVEENAEGVVSVSKQLANGILRRQDAPRAFDMNASIYVWRRDSLMETPQVFFPSTRLYEMPPERSHDIDSELDFRIVEFLLKEASQGVG
jgi:CMP-N,N'-diacetyllegionaminic acid synthase